MGHWSESLVDEFIQQVGDTPDRNTITSLLRKAGHEVEALAGRSFQPARRGTSIFESNGLPLVDVPDLQIDSMEPVEGVWAIPDPANRELATALQVLPLDAPAVKSLRDAEALWIAGLLMAKAAHDGSLSADFVVHWLGKFLAPEKRKDLLRYVMDPSVRFYIPILGIQINDWWFQIARRLMWITNETEDDGRLFELLLDKSLTGGISTPLAASEATMIAAPMTRQPLDRAFKVRVWPEGVQRPINRPWSKIAATVHTFGIPIVTIDKNSTPTEVACQMVLKGYWHGFIDSNDPALADALVKGYPRQVDKILRNTDALDKRSAASLLLEQLIHPGFDPAQGAEATRRYVRRKTRIAVIEYKKRETPDRYPWTQIGISERRYYKLLPNFTEKTNGRYEVDQDEIIKRMKDHLNEKDTRRAIQAAARDVLRSHGFSESAARKWLQRHRPEDAITAWPRGLRP